MTTCRSRAVSESNIELALSVLEDTAYYSEKAGCLVTVVVCLCCGQKYEEELVHAAALMVCEKPFKCIECDIAAEERIKYTLTLSGWMGAQ